MYNPFRPRSTDPGRIPEDDIEKALSQFCAPPAFDKKKGSQPSISDGTFQRIAELLNHLQAHHYARGWSDRPRTYTVLRNIQRLDLFQPFIDLGLNDIAFPYTIEKIPDLIPEDDLKDRFLRHQRYILTTASQLEDGQHALTKNGDDLFRLVRHLGRGGFGYVTCIFLHSISFAARFRSWEPGDKSFRCRVNPFLNALYRIELVVEVSSSYFAKSKGC